MFSVNASEYPNTLFNHFLVALSNKPQFLNNKKWKQKTSVCIVLQRILYKANIVFLLLSFIESFAPNNTSICVFVSYVVLKVNVKLVWIVTLCRNVNPSKKKLNCAFVLTIYTVLWYTWLCSTVKMDKAVWYLIFR